MNKFEEDYLYLNRKYAIFPEDGTRYVWSITENEVSYNTDSSTEDLENGDGSTYSGYARCLESYDNLVIFEIEDGCGGQYRMIFEKEKEIQ